MLFEKKKYKIKTTRFNLFHFLFGTISFGVLNTSLICCVLIQYFNDNGMLPLQLSIIIISKRFLRLFCDSLFGVIFDRFGAKIVFLIGRVLKLISYLILLKFNHFYGFIVAMLLDGASYSSIYGKIGSYIYNNLSINKKINLFPQAMSIYYFCMDVTIATMTFFAGILLKTYGYNVIIYLSIIMNIFSIFILIKYVGGYEQNIEKYKVKNIKDIFIDLKEAVKNNNQFLYLLCLYGIVSFMAWQFHSISSLILLDMKISSINIAFCGTILKLSMGCGALFSIILHRKQIINLRQCLILLLLLMFFGIISAILYNFYFFYIFCLLIVFIYTTIEVVIEKNFDYYSNKTIRGTSISLAMTFCSILAMVSNLFIGLVAQYVNYKIGLIIILCFIFFIILYIYLRSK